MNIIIILINGIAMGGIYALIALGFVLIYKSSHVLNFAQGSLVLVGAYIIFSFSIQLGFSTVVSLLMGAVVASVMGMGFQHFILSRMVGKPLISIIMITIGLDYLIKGVCLGVWGPIRRVFPTNMFPDISMKFGEVYISSLFLWGFIISISALVGFSLFFKFTRIGVAMRAVSNDQMAALSLGIDIDRILMLVWAIACVVALIGGALMASLSVLDLHLGFIGMVVFPVIIFGGIDSIPGVIIGGFTIGLVESLSGAYLEGLVGGGVRSVAPFIVMLLVLMVRPYGLLGTKEIERL